MGTQPAAAEVGATAADRSYEDYAEEVQRLVRLERDPKASPSQRRAQAHLVAQSWGRFLRTYTKLEAVGG